MHLYIVHLLKFVNRSKVMSIVLCSIITISENHHLPKLKLNGLITTIVYLPKPKLNGLIIQTVHVKFVKS